MSKLYIAAGVFAATLIASAAQADGPDICGTAAIGVEGRRPQYENGRRSHRERVRKRPIVKGRARRQGNLLPSRRIKGRPNHDNP